jgi:hypothetical protein
MSRLSQDCPYSDAQLDRIVAAVGGLPDGDYQEYQPTDENAQLDDEIRAFCMDSELKPRERYRAKPRHDVLMERLGRAVWWWDLTQRRKESETFSPHQLAARTRRIETAAKQLLTALGADSSGSFDAMPDQLIWALGDETRPEAEKLAREMGQEFDPPRLMLARAISQIINLRKWAERAAKKAEGGGKVAREARHEADKAFDGFVASLAGIYFEVFERRPGCARTNNQPAGPFLRFVKACLEPLLGGDMPSDFALEKRIRKAARPYAKISRKAKGASPNQRGKRSTSATRRRR